MLNVCNCFFWQHNLEIYLMGFIVFINLTNKLAGKLWESLLSLQKLIQAHEADGISL